VKQNTASWDFLSKIQVREGEHWATCWGTLGFSRRGKLEPFPIPKKNSVLPSNFSIIQKTIPHYGSHLAIMPPCTIESHIISFNPNAPKCNAFMKRP